MRQQAEHLPLLLLLLQREVHLLLLLLLFLLHLPAAEGYPQVYIHLDRRSLPCLLQ